MFIQRNFLYLVMALSVGFAIFMGATVYQKPATPPPLPLPSVSAAFRAYWFGGKAELNQYSLSQAQYGAVQPGQTVLIFVTEDFRTDRQVKAETEASRGVAVPVLKTNFIRRFATGIYDYSLFTSVFTPVPGAGPNLFPNTLKVSTSVQEWCGHSYVQLNYRNNAYTVTGRSYFEAEATEDYTVAKTLLEDELWNRIRLDPARLPIGEVEVIPGTQAARLRHKRLDPLPATATLDTARGRAWATTYRPAAPGKCLAYSLDYEADARQLSIYFDETFPHRILGWEDTYLTKTKRLTTRAILQKTTQSDYWNHNTPTDSAFVHR